MWMKKKNEACPNCGYCPHCGRAKAGWAPAWPTYPVWPTYPMWINTTTPSSIKLNTATVTTTGGSSVLGNNSTYYFNTAGAAPVNGSYTYSYTSSAPDCCTCDETETEE